MDCEGSFIKGAKNGLMVPFHLLEIKTLKQQENCVTSHFTHFYQYQAISFVINKIVCSVGYPRKTNLNSAICEIRNFFGDFSDFSQFDLTAKLWTLCQDSKTAKVKYSKVSRDPKEVLIERKSCKEPGARRNYYFVGIGEVNLYCVTCVR